ncbi:endonuclease [Alphaproteobacteria bacterium 46_93_T64]|nr:endonuclease [Alphaproteobacteria bacterium 46_93_T64]
MDWTLYILECADGSLYTGITNNLEKRVAAHENGMGAKYTKGRGPFSVVYIEELENRSVATKRELAVKKLNRQDKVDLVKSYQVRSSTRC